MELDGRSTGSRRVNPLTDKFGVKSFHHVEFYCGDATTTARRFASGLGMRLIAKSDQSTGNFAHSSHVVQSGSLRLVFTAPGGPGVVAGKGKGAPPPPPPPPLPSAARSPLPGFDPGLAHEFFRKHGLAGRAIGLEVHDAREAHREFTGSGGVSVLEPTRVTDENGSATLAEVQAYGDVVLRFVSFGQSENTAGDGPSQDAAAGQASQSQSTGNGVGLSEEATAAVAPGYSGPFLPNFAPAGPGGAGPEESFLERIDHAVGNVWDMMEHVEHLARCTGFHEFAEFTAEDVGTVDSGLNSMVLASNNELVLLPINEPTYGTRKKSQIQTYLEQNDGPGLQHLALKSTDIFRTMRMMRERSAQGGFEFMDPPGDAYYQDLAQRIPELSGEQLKQIEELGLLADKDDQGILLQVFTKPVGDRATFFLEIIQRIGCEYQGPSGQDLQRGGCGGFGKGNFKALFQSIENYLDREVGA